LLLLTATHKEAALICNRRAVIAVHNSCSWRQQHCLWGRRRPSLLLLPTDKVQSFSRDL